MAFLWPFLASEMDDSNNSESSRDSLRATVGFFLVFVANAFAQETTGVAEVERVIVTGSNIPTAEESRAKSSGYLSSG